MSDNQKSASPLYGLSIIFTVIFALASVFWTQLGNMQTQIDKADSVTRIAKLEQKMDEVNRLIPKSEHEHERFVDKDDNFAKEIASMKVQFVEVETQFRTMKEYFLSRLDSMKTDRELSISKLDDKLQLEIGHVKELLEERFGKRRATDAIKVIQTSSGGETK